MADAMPALGGLFGGLNALAAGGKPKRPPVKPPGKVALADLPSKRTPVSRSAMEAPVTMDGHWSHKARIPGTRTPRSTPAMPVQPGPSEAEALKAEAQARGSDLTWDLRGIIPGTRPRSEASASEDARRAEHLARLATPRSRGASASSVRRALGQEYEEYARQTTRSLFPQDVVGESPVDAWHTAGQDGYRSAVFYAAVRCRELLCLNTVDVVNNLEGESTAVFGSYGTGNAPELSRLHAACILLEELTQVSSPLQDTLRFVFRELCSCIFNDFSAGADILLLTPFFMMAHQTREELNQALARAEIAEEARVHADAQCVDLYSEVENLRETVRVERAALAERAATFDTLIDERDTLRVKVSQLSESADIRTDDFRELCSEHSKLQASLFVSKRDLEVSTKNAMALGKQVSDQQQHVKELESKIEDLHSALEVANRGRAALDEVPVQQAMQMAELPPEVEKHLAHQRGGAASGSSHVGPRGSGQIDTRRLLKLPMPNGGCQIFMKSSACDARDTQVLGIPRRSGRAGSTLDDAYVLGGAVGDEASMIVLEPEAFSALQISQGLPKAVCWDRTLTGDTETIVREVASDVQALALEHQATLSFCKRLRKDLEESMALIPEWNVDELRGIIRSVLVFDKDKVRLVPNPVEKNTHFVGLGQAESVPSFLQYDGTLAYTDKPAEEILLACRDFWIGRTKYVVSRVGDGAAVDLVLAEYFSEDFLASVSRDRKHQMEFTYNFLYTLRTMTTLVSTEHHAQELQEAIVVETPSPTSPGSQTGTRGSIPTAQSAQETKVPEETKVPAPKAVVNVHFQPHAEIMYRALLGEISEDLFHDQTTMLVSLLFALVAMSERFPCRSVQSQEQDGSVFLGLAELSATLRLFFPSKQREQLSALKRIVFMYASRPDEDESKSTPTVSGAVTPRSHVVPTPDPTTSPHTLRKQTQSLALPDGFQQKGRQAERQMAPPVVDVSRMFGVMFNGACVADDETFLADFMLRPTQFVTELQRQHVCECVAFVDRLQKAFRAAGHKRTEMLGTATAERRRDGEEASHGSTMVNVKQADAALATADQHLSEIQRGIYILRGFGIRLPEVPGGAVSGVEKLRPMLKQRITQLELTNTMVSADTFVHRVSSGGVARGARQWQPDIHVRDVAREAGVTLCRSATMTGPLMEFLDSYWAGPGEVSNDRMMDRKVTRETTSKVTSKLTSTKSLDASVAPWMEALDEIEEEEIEETPSTMHGKFRATVVSGSELTELGAGYPALLLSYWLAVAR